MADSIRPKKVERAKVWTDAVEEGKLLSCNNSKILNFCRRVVVNTIFSCTLHCFTAYRFQLAGYRDENEYLSVNKGKSVSLEFR